MSASETDAEMTIAARVGCGRFRSRPGTKTSITVIAAGSHQARHLGLRSRLLGDRRPRPARAHGEPLEQARRDVGCSDADHLPVPVDLLARASRERGCRGDRVRERHQRDPERTERERAHVRQRHPRDRERREPLRQRADQRHPTAREVEDRRDRDRCDHDDQDARATSGSHRWRTTIRTRPTTPIAERRRHRLTPRDPVDEPHEFADEPVGVDREPEQFRKLADQDRQGETVHVADHGGLGQQVGDEPQPRDAGEDHDGTDHQCQDGGQRDGLHRIAVGHQQRQEGRSDHRAQGRIRSEHQDLARAEDRVREQAQDRGVEPGDRGESGKFRVRHPLRHQERREDETCHDIFREPVALIGRDHPNPRHE